MCAEKGGGRGGGTEKLGNEADTDHTCTIHNIMLPTIDVGLKGSAAEVLEVSEQ